VRLLHLVVQRTARLSAQYLAAGFVHGVLNSDNINVTGESFDYGPWRWTPFWDGHFTAAYYDHAGHYAFGRQPEAIHWDLVQLATALKTVAPVEALTAVLGTFPDRFQRALRDALFARLAVEPGDVAEDIKLIVAIETALASQTVEIDRFFFDWRGGAPRGGSPAAAAYEAADFNDLRREIGGRRAIGGALDHPYWSDAAPCAMHIEEVEAIWSAIDERDDWAPLEAKIAAVRRMGEAMRAAAHG
jgi:uncharacterized protein YdiU (UPF0061 family)